MTEADTCRRFVVPRTRATSAAPTAPGSRTWRPGRPAILTTSQLLTTGVDAPTCKNVVLVRTVGSMPEFKQIIGRGTRLRPDYGKLAFNIVDYTGTATEKFADPDFDGEPVEEHKETIDDAGRDTSNEADSSPDDPHHDGFEYEGRELEGRIEHPDGTDLPRKYYVDGGEVEIIRHLVYDLDPDGRKLSCRQLTDYAGDKLRTLYPDAAALRRDWLDADRRAEIVAHLEERGIDLATLGEAAARPDADPFDLLCHLAYHAPLRTRRERAERLHREEREFFAHYGPEARRVLDALIEKYAEHGAAQSLIVIEEPEATVHPGAIGSILDVLRHAGRFMQVVATTHSPDVLDAKWLQDRNLRIASWESGTTRVSAVSPAVRVALREHLMGAGESLRANAMTAAEASERDKRQFKLFVKTT